MGFKAQIIISWLILVLPILICGVTERFGIDTVRWWVVMFSWVIVGVCICLFAVWV